jgi:hypothetical protein
LIWGDERVIRCCEEEGPAAAAAAAAAVRSLLCGAAVRREQSASLCCAHSPFITEVGIPERFNSLFQISVALAVWRHTSLAPRAPTQPGKVTPSVLSPPLARTHSVTIPSELRL